MLFQVDLTGISPQEVFPQFWPGQTHVAEDVRAFAEALVLGVIRHRASLDGIVADCSQHWRVERMAVVDRNVLRMAVYEMLFTPDTPRVVIIDEAIEVAKRFGGDESGAFVNGVLDAIRKSADRGAIPVPPSD